MYFQQSFLFLINAISKQFNSTAKKKRSFYFSLLFRLQDNFIWIFSMLLTVGIGNVSLHNISDKEILVLGFPGKYLQSINRYYQKFKASISQQCPESISPSSIEIHSFPVQRCSPFCTMFNQNWPLSVLVQGGREPKVSFISASEYQQKSNVIRSNFALTL